MNYTDFKQKPLCLTVHIRTDSTHVQYSTSCLIISSKDSLEVILPEHQNDRYIIAPGLLYLLPADKAEWKVYRISHGICEISDNNILINCIYCADMQLSTNLKARLDSIRNPYAKLHTHSFQESPMDALLKYKP